MELKLLKTIEVPDGPIINTYIIGDYIISEHTHKSFSIVYSKPDLNAKDFLPYIFAEDEKEDGNITDFRIETTSYGTLKVEDTKRFIEAYKEALEVAEILKAKFVSKDK